MADISQEIAAFQNAVYGEEVRSSMVSLAEKLNDVTEDDQAAIAEFRTGFEQATRAADDAATFAHDAAVAANTAAATVDSATASANAAAASATSAGNTATQQAQAASDLSTQVQTAETARVNAETSRQSAESSRVSAESARDTAESARRSDETSRKSYETQRQSAETARADAEAARQTAEARRAADFAIMEQRSKGWLRYYCADGEFDPTTRRPAIADPDESTLYYIPAEHPTADNQWVEWQYDTSGDRWEIQGTTEATVSPVTTAQIDAIADDETVTSSNVLQATGLTYLWAKLKAAFAPLVHVHSASDITDGTLAVARGGTGVSTAAAERERLGLGSTTGALPIANGGTGASNAADARTALGAAPASHVHSADDVTSGTLPVARGGTGATTVEEARTALGLGSLATRSSLGLVISPKEGYVKDSSARSSGANYRIDLTLEAMSGYIPLVVLAVYSSSDQASLRGFDLDGITTGGTPILKTYWHANGDISANKATYFTQLLMMKTTLP